MSAIRLAPPFVALALIGTPALAQDAAPTDDSATAPVESSDVVSTLRDPQVQATATAAAAILGELLLDVPVGPLVAVMDDTVDRLADEAGTQPPARTEVAPDATLRDLVGPQGDRMATELATRVPQAMEAAAEVAVAVEKAKPALGKLAAKMKRALPANFPSFPRD